MSDLRDRMLDAMTAVHEQRAHDQIKASPRTHCRAKLDAIMPLVEEAIREAKARQIVSAIFGVPDKAPMPFALHRRSDVTGVSGTGVVATGVQFPDGTVVIRWSGENPSTVVWESIAAAMKVHGHDGKTQVVWLAEDLGSEEAVAAEKEHERHLQERAWDECARRCPRDGVLLPPNPYRTDEATP